MSEYTPTRACLDCGGIVEDDIHEYGCPRTGPAPSREIERLAKQSCAIIDGRFPIGGKPWESHNAYEQATWYMVVAYLHNTPAHDELVAALQRICNWLMAYDGSEEYTSKMLPALREIAGAALAKAEGSTDAESG